MRGLIGGTFVALALAATPAAGEALCGEEFAEIPELEALIKAKPGVQVLSSDSSFVSYSDPATNFIWNFTVNGHEAYPSVACRRLIAVDGAYNVATEISCGADKSACDRLAESYNELDRRMRESTGQK
jgi:hypothetical protein